jgi:hypothetical protein
MEHGRRTTWHNTEGLNLTQCSANFSSDGTPDVNIAS